MKRIPQLEDEAAKLAQAYATKSYESQMATGRQLGKRFVKQYAAGDQQGMQKTAHEMAAYRGSGAPFNLGTAMRIIEANGVPSGVQKDLWNFANNDLTENGTASLLQITGQRDNLTDAYNWEESLERISADFE